jgi:hypothetical protein
MEIVLTLDKSSRITQGRDSEPKSKAYDE